MSRACSATTPARTGRSGRPTALVLAMLGALALFQGRAAARDEPPAPASLERAVKAAYLYHFTKFVSWPANSPFSRELVLSIGVLGDDSFADTLEATLRDKKVEGRPFAVRRFRAADEVVPCAALFVARAKADRMPQLLRQLEGLPVLTVSDAEGFTSRGGIIGLFIEDNRVAFEIGLGAARTAGLSVSSKLLRLSRPAGRACAGCGAGTGEER